MWYPAKITDAPTAEPITLAQAKEHLRVDVSDEDTLIAGLITAAREHVEKYCNVLFAEQTVEVKCDSFSDLARLPVAPVIDVTSISYVDPEGVDTVLPETEYEVRDDGLEAGIVLEYGKQWPGVRRGSRITVTMDAGFEEAPAAVIHAMKLWIGDAYATRENGKLEDWTALDALLSNHRRGA